MKTRQGFISNSSSSSFVINLEDITARQLQMIVDHAEIAEEMKLDEYPDEWTIRVKQCEAGFGEVEGFTFMDNFDMHHFLSVIGIPDNVIRWDEENDR